MEHLVRLYNMQLQVAFLAHQPRLKPLVHYVGNDYIAVEVRDADTGNCYFGNIHFPNTNLDVMDHLFVETQQIYFEGNKANGND